MISKVVFSNLNDTPISYIKNVEAISSLKEINFSPGLNIIFGKNGSGKSTIIALLAKMLHCLQGGVSKITQRSISDVFSLFEKMYSGVDILHDGQCVYHYNPSVNVGCIGGSFDDDFFEEGLNSMFIKGSSGQLAIHEIGKIFSQSKKSENKPVFSMQKDKVNSSWSKRIEQIEDFLKPKIEKSKVTYLLDEPDRSMDIPTQKKFWELMGSMSRYQVIIATHSVFSLNVKDANYVELSPGYLEECRKCL
jgi:predicted ATPase